MTYQHVTPAGLVIRYSQQAAEAIGRVEPQKIAALSEVSDAPAPSKVDRLDPDQPTTNRADRRAVAHMTKRGYL